MKNHSAGFLSACLLWLVLPIASRAAFVSGFVRCDANQNQIADAGDVGIGNVLIIITNQSGGFSNFTHTAADGSFTVQIPDFSALAERQDPLSQVYVESLSFPTLPADSTVLFPLPILYLGTGPAFYIDFAADLTNVVYTSATSNGAPTGNWLIQSPECQGTASAGCLVTGAGTIRRITGRPDHVFAGTVSGRASGNPRGHWRDASQRLNLRFASTSVESVSCEIPDATSSFNVLQFTGRGTLRRIFGRRVNFGEVLFTARVEDHGPGARDGYYLRVYSADGTTLMLVSGDPANPENIATVPISGGNLRVRSL